jgi:hypothetical protein
MRHLATVILLSASTAHAGPLIGIGNPKLSTLRVELSQLTREEAIQRLDHFAALCSVDGYPLVHDLVTTSATHQMQPSDLCTTVRDTTGRAMHPRFVTKYKLEELRAHLLALKAGVDDQALPRFRALCDADGYPLVSDIPGDKHKSLEPSELCRRVRRIEQ